MDRWTPSARYQKIAAANRAFYAAVATQYDDSETCVCDPAAQGMLEEDLEDILRRCRGAPHALSALDACGGSGNVSLKLLRRGVRVTLVDISPELLDIFRRKCAIAGTEAATEVCEIASFLAKHPAQFDLIVFSSALHHLEDIEGVLRLAHGALTPGGLLFTVFDPTSTGQSTPVTRALLRLDYTLFKVLDQTSDLPAALRRRLRRRLSNAGAHRKTDIDLDENTAGMLAEYHVEEGIDDLALVDALTGMGFEVVRHERYATARHRWIRRLLEATGAVSSFKLLLRKAGG